MSNVNQDEQRNMLISSRSDGAEVCVYVSSRIFDMLMPLGDIIQEGLDVRALRLSEEDLPYGYTEK